MKTLEAYTDLKGRTIDLGELEDAERDLIQELIDRQRRESNWQAFSNYWMPRVANFYLPRGLSRRQITAKAAWKIAQDLDGRLAIRLGLARPSDYRDELEELIRDRFPTHRAFCEATGISEDLLSHVLARRKHLAIDTLSDALQRIGYRLHIVPLDESKT